MTSNPYSSTQHRTHSLLADKLRPLRKTAQKGSKHTRRYILVDFLYVSSLRLLVTPQCGCITSLTVIFSYFHQRTRRLPRSARRVRHKQIHFGSLHPNTGWDRFSILSSANTTNCKSQNLPTFKHAHTVFYSHSRSSAFRNGLFFSLLSSRVNAVDSCLASSANKESNRHKLSQSRYQFDLPSGYCPRQLSG